MDTGCVTADRVAEDKSGEPSDELDDPVGGHCGHRDHSPEKKADGYGRVVMRSRYVAAHVNHRREGSADGKRRESPSRSCQRDGAEEDECADELGKQAGRKSHSWERFFTRQIAPLTSETTIRAR